jgi:hypothetical protein
MRPLATALFLLPTLAMAATSTPGQTTSLLWRSLSHAPGVPADTVALDNLFHPDAVVFGARYQDGQPRLSALRAKDFVVGLERIRPTGFYECEVAREVKTYDRFATVYSIVESRTDKAAEKADFVGVNSIQLYKTGDEWKIVSLYYHVEKPGLPISLEGGKSGVCQVAPPGSS